MFNGGNGIVCDLCAAHCSGYFTYYSLSFSILHFGGGQQPETPAVLACDACSDCFNNIRLMIERNYRAIHNGFVCDCCGKIVEQTPTGGYYGTVTKIEICEANTEYKCVSCDAVVSNKPEAICMCGGAVFTVKPGVAIYTQFCQLVVCANDFNEFANVVTKFA